MHNCASFLAHYRVIRNIPDASFTFTEMVLGKMLLPPGAISHGLTSIFVDSSFFSRDCNSSLRFLRGIHNICNNLGNKGHSAVLQVAYGSTVFSNKN